MSQKRKSFKVNSKKRKKEGGGKKLALGDAVGDVTVGEAVGNVVGS